MFKEKPIIVAAYIVCTVLALAAVLPFGWVVMTAIKPAPEINAWPPSLFPHEPTLAHFYKILAEEDFLRYVFNSMVIALFAKYRFPLRGVLFTIVLATAVIPLEVYIIPLYLMVFHAGMLNTFPALIFPFIIMTFGVFFMRQVIMAIPDELLEAARVDGASEFWIYLRIILHLSKSGLMALGVFAFSEAWAHFIWPLVMVTSKDMYTSELGLATYQRQFYIEYGPISAGAVICIIPMMIVFALLRRHIMQGIATSGLRG